jgi:hypothetical protein
MTSIWQQGEEEELLEIEDGLYFGVFTNRPSVIAARLPRPEPPSVVSTDPWWDRLVQETRNQGVFEVGSRTSSSDAYIPLHPGGSSDRPGS